MALADELNKLAELHASGRLTEEEFRLAKERLLNAEHDRPAEPLSTAVNSFRRSRTDRWFGGVCGGIARSTGMEAWVWRLLFAVLFIFAGAGLLVYLLLWIFVRANDPGEIRCNENLSEYTVYIDMHSILSISQTDPRPMYLQIKEQIRYRVAVGDWRPGQEIPSIRALAIAVQVSVITVKRAYLELEREGVIVTRQGKGSFVTSGAHVPTNLMEQELDDHLTGAARIGRLLDLSDKELADRLQRIARDLKKKDA